MAAGRPLSGSMGWQRLLHRKFGDRDQVASCASQSSRFTRVFCVSTPRGRNLPTRYLYDDLDHESLSEGLRQLVWDIFGETEIATRCVGFIRNVVPTPDTTYTYPVPWAHVPVFLITDPAQPVVEGTWVGADRARSELADRHWWPIVEDYLTR